MKKNRILLLCSLLITKIAVCHNSDSYNNLQANSVVEQVYEKLEVSSRLPRFTNKYIDRISKNRPDVPDSLWQTIKDSIDYSQFKNLATQILSNYYTTSELQNLLNKYSDQLFIPIEYISLRNRLYEALEQFNPNIVSQINNILTANNHSQIASN